jgi:hypothetical protein
MNAALRALCLLATAALAWVLFNRAHARPALLGGLLGGHATRRLPRGWPPLPPALRAVHPRSYDAALRDLGHFADVFARTFRPEAAGSDQGPRLVRELFAARARVLRDLHELRMRLPNDLELETAAVHATEEQDHAMHDHIEDAKERCGVPGLHPGPVDGLFYNRWYRAANDDIK